MRKTPAAFLNIVAALVDSNILFAGYQWQLQIKNDNNAIKIKYDYPKEAYIFDIWKLLVI
jgi:hypothetical protein